MNAIEKCGRRVEDITKIYRGKDNYCRCGCGGNYFYKDEPEDSKGFKRALNQILKEKYNESEIEDGGSYINIPYESTDPDGKCLCVYFN